MFTCYEQNVAGCRELAGSDSESLTGSEADAYSEFRALAHAFRTWRTHARNAAEARATLDEAVDNWRVAIAFWEVHCARRVLRAWAGRRRAQLAAVLDFWVGTSLRQAFLQWREVGVGVGVGKGLCGPAWAGVPAVA